MANIIENKAFECADKIADALGYFVVDIEYKKETNGKVLRIYLDKDGGIGIDECEKFSRAFEEEFDKLDAVDDAYILEVSSPGVDRVLKTEREFLYYIGRRVEVKLYKAIESQKVFDGILEEFSDNTAKIKTQEKEILVPVKEAVYIRLYFEF